MQDAKRKTKKENQSGWKMRISLKGKHRRSIDK